MKPIHTPKTVIQTSVADGITFKSGLHEEYIFELNANRTRLRFHEACQLADALAEHIARCRDYRRARR